MNPVLVISKVRSAGGSVSVLDGDLRVTVPPGILSPEDRAVLAEHKQDLVRVLGSPEPIRDEYAEREREAIEWVERWEDDRLILERAGKEFLQVVDPPDMGRGGPEC